MEEVHKETIEMVSHADGPTWERIKGMVNDCQDESVFNRKLAVAKRIKRAVAYFHIGLVACAAVAFLYFPALTWLAERVVGVPEHDAWLLAWGILSLSIIGPMLFKLWGDGS